MTLYYFSSALASQVASRTAALEILGEMGKRPNNLSPTQFKKHVEHTKAECWWIGLRVAIAPFWETGKSIIEATFHKGISTIISWKDIAKRLWKRADEKSLGLEVIRVSATHIKVEGKQAKSGYWNVLARPDGLECDCWLYRCQHNRMVLQGEAPSLLKAIKSNKPQLKQLFNTETMQLEEVPQLVCHHIKAAMRSCFDVETVEDYLLVYADVTKLWKERQQRKQPTPNDWGNLNFDIQPPQAKPFLPEGSYLERTDDWIFVEYRVWSYIRKTRIQEGEIPITTKCIGRLVEQGNEFVAYGSRSGFGTNFSNKFEAIAHLIRRAGYSLEEVAQAYQLHQNYNR